MHGTDVLTCMDALMPRAQDAQERPTILLYFLRLGNCSMHCSTFQRLDNRSCIVLLSYIHVGHPLVACIVLPSDILVGRMAVSALVGHVK